MSGWQFNKLRLQEKSAYNRHGSVYCWGEGRGPGRCEGEGF